MDVGHQKIGPSNIKESIITPGADIQIEAEVEAKTYLYIACITREIQTTGQEIAPSS
jgi:hypothetical protein